MKKISIKILKEQKEPKGNPQAPKVLIVGDSIAAGMVVVAHKEGIVNKPQCEGKHYFSCVTKTARGSTYSDWALRRVRKYFASPENARPANDKGIMIISTGTNDALDIYGQAAKGKKSSKSPTKTAKNISRIIQLANANGYETVFKPLGPYFPKGRTRRKRLQVFNKFAEELHKLISTKMLDVQLGEGDMRDVIHPNNAGSMKYLEAAEATRLSNIYDPNHPDYESGADDPK